MSRPAHLCTCCAAPPHQRAQDPASGARTPSRRHRGRRGKQDWRRGTSSEAQLSRAARRARRDSAPTRPLGRQRAWDLTSGCGTRDRTRSGEDRGADPQGARATAGKLWARRGDAGERTPGAPHLAPGNARPRPAPRVPSPACSACPACAPRAARQRRPARPRTL